MLAGCLWVSVSLGYQISWVRPRRHKSIARISLRPGANLSPGCGILLQSSGMAGLVRPDLWMNQFAH